MTNETHATLKTFLRLPRVLELTGLSTTELYKKMREDQFPRCIPIGPRAVAWDQDEVAAWQRDRINMRGKHVGKPGPGRPGKSNSESRAAV